MNTATMGTFGMTAMQPRMPMRLAGLCSGPSGTHSSMASSTLSSMRTGSEYFSPPWSTRWPTAAMDDMSEMTPIFGSARTSSTMRMAS